MKALLKLALPVLMLCSSSLSFGQTFNRTYDIGNYICNAGTVVPCADGTFVTFAAIYSAQEGGLIFYKINSSGDTLFTKRYWFPQRIVMTGISTSAWELQDGRIVYAGGIADSGDINRDFHFVVFSAQGDTLQSLRIGSNLNDKSNSAVIIDDSMVVAVGYVVEANGLFTDPAITRYSIGSNTAVLNQINVQGQQTLVSVDHLVDDDFILSGTSDAEYYVCRYNINSNYVLWDTILPSTYYYGYCTVVDTTAFFVAGMIEEVGGGFNSRLYRFKTDGSVVWSRDFGLPVTVEAIITKPIYDYSQHCVYLGGIYSDASTNDSGWLLRCDSAGTPLYSSIISSANGFGVMPGDFRATTSGFIIAGFNYANNGDVWLVRTDTAGCLVPGCLTNVSAVMNTVDATLTVFPNPATEFLTIQLQTEERTTGTLEVYGLSGQLVLRQQVVFENYGSGVTVNIGELPNGLYSVVVRTTTSESFVKRFVKQN